MRVPGPVQAENPNVELRCSRRQTDRSRLPYTDISVTIACMGHAYTDSVALTFTASYTDPLNDQQQPLARSGARPVAPPRASAERRNGSW
jgi:hypothetical protein